MDSWLIYGKGGHAQVIADAILKKDSSATVEYFEDRDFPYNAEFNAAVPLIIGIGNNEVRKRISKTISHSFATIIHPSAQIATDVIIGEGTVVFANAVIQTGTVIGKHCIINANSTIDHDVIIEDFVSVYPGVYVGGGALISTGKTLEANQVIARNATL